MEYTVVGYYNDNCQVFIYPSSGETTDEAVHAAVVEILKENKGLDFTQLEVVAVFKGCPEDAGGPDYVTSGEHYLTHS